MDANTMGFRKVGVFERLLSDFDGRFKSHKIPKEFTGEHRAPFFTISTPRNARDAALIVPSLGGISRVYSLSCLAHLLKSVVAATALKMINLNRPIAVNHHPDDAMGPYGVTQKTTMMVSILRFCGECFVFSAARVPAFHPSFSRISASLKPFKASSLPKQFPRFRLVAEQLQKSFLCESAVSSHFDLQVITVVRGDGCRNTRCPDTIARKDLLGRAQT